MSFITGDIKACTIAQLRALDDLTLKQYKTFYCDEAGKEGFWEYDPNDSSSVDNLGTILVTGTGKVLKRIIQGNNINASWFDDSSNIEHSVVLNRLFSEAFNKNLSINLEKKIYVTNITLQLKNNLLGNNATIKLKNNSSIANGNPIIQIANDNVSIFDFTLDGNRSNNMGTINNGTLGISCNQFFGFRMKNVNIFNVRNRGLQVTDSPFFEWEGGKLDNCGRYDSEASTAQADRIGVLIDNYASTPNTSYYMGQESSIKSVVISNCGLDGIQVGVGMKLYDIVAYNCGLEYINHNDGAAGIYARPPQNVISGTCDGLQIVDCTCYNNTGLGIDVGNNAGSTNNPKMTNVLIHGNTVYGNYLHGIGVASLENCIISSNICYNNGTRVILPEGSGSNTRRAGIGIDTVVISGSIGIPFKNIIVQNNICYDTRSGSNRTQQNGLFLGTFTRNHGSETLTVVDNDFTRNVGKSILGLSYQSPVISSSILSVRNNLGVNNYTVGVSSGLNVFPLSDHLYLIASSNINIGGIDASSLGNIITLENVSAFQITLIASPFFKMLNSGNLILQQNKPVSFIYTYETGNYIWKQLPIQSSDIAKTQLTGYTKATTTRAITSSDDIITAMGILEKSVLFPISGSLNNGYVELTNSEITTNSRAIIQTLQFSGSQSAVDYTYDVSTSNIIKITARNISGSIETGCQSRIIAYIRN